MDSATGGISRRIMSALAALVIGASLLPGCATLPDDGLGATNARFDELRDLRYCELLLIGGDALAHDLRAAIYNTTDLNQGPNSGDSCPTAAWDRIEAWGLQQHFGVLAVLKNGPRHWLLDWIELPVGTERDFNGLKARWMGELHPPKGAHGQEIRSAPYRPTTLVRRSAMGFAKGRPVFFLQSPDGVPWVMPSYAGGSETGLSYDDLQGLSGRLKLPPGWAYRVKVLDRHLTLRAVEGRTRVIQDELDNSYAACFEMACSYAP